MTIFVGGANNDQVTVGYKTASYTITMAGNSSTFYPILVTRPMGAKITINKHVHSGGNWDGYCQFQLETNPYGWGGWNNTVVLKQYERSHREFIHSYGSTPSAGTYIIIYLLGGNGPSSARSYSVNLAGFGAPTLANSGSPYYTATAITSNGTTSTKTASDSGQIQQQTLVA